MTEQEGVIKYELDFTSMHQAFESDLIVTLNQARQLMLEQGLIGQDAARYDGYGFGNISIRDANAQQFVISGTQTGELQTLQARDLALVEVAQPENNYLKACGITKPSSEALTHAVFYQKSDRVGAVIHVHSPLIWKYARQLGLCGTNANVPYGTPAMAEAMSVLYDRLIPGGLPVTMVMFGHEDGVITAGESLSQCAQVLIALNARASACG